MARESLENKKKRVLRIVSKLKKTYPDAHCALHFESPFQLAIATILSAQCTDERVNQVTPVLFSRFPDARAMARASLEEIELIIHSAGFYRNKSKSIKEMSTKVVEEHQGKIPRSMEELVRLRGIGRKTANVILGVAFGIPEGVVVDTHVGRISRRLGLTREKDPVKVERDLVALLPQKEWTIFSHLLIDHGRAICSARFKPKCAECSLMKDCSRVGVS